ncbi:MAG: hypothetical protein ABIO43_05680 [Sphingomicrobium sp.]
MRKQNIENAAYDVAIQIQTVENSIDSTLGDLAELQSKMVHARGVTGVGVATAHGAFEQLAATVQALVAARGGMVRCHAELVSAKQSVPGLRTVSFGDNECPPVKGQVDLRIVA